MLILIGAPGAGVSSVATATAQRLDLPLYDVDALIAAEAGKPVSHIYVDEGEAVAREREIAAIAQALSHLRGVVAMASGAVLHAEFSELVADHQVVWLKVDMPHMARRLRLGAISPGILGSPRVMLVSMLAERDPLYAAIADHSIDTNKLSLDQVIDDVVAYAQHTLNAQP